MKSVLGYVNEKTAESSATVRWSARILVLGFAFVLVVALVMFGPFDKEANSAVPQTAPQTNVSMDGCYANNHGCGRTHGEQGAAEYKFYECAGGAIIGGVFGGYGGAATMGVGCYWYNSW